MADVIVEERPLEVSVSSRRITPDKPYDPKTLVEEAAEAQKKEAKAQERKASIRELIHKEKEKANIGREHVKIILSERGVLSALDHVKANYLKENPDSNAFRDTGSIKAKGDSSRTIGVIRWDPEEREIPNIGKKLVSKAVRVVCQNVQTEKGFETGIEQISYAVEKDLVEVDPETGKLTTVVDQKTGEPRKSVVWERLTLADTAKSSFTLEQKIKEAMRRADLGNAKMFDDREFSGGVLIGEPGIGQKSV